MRPVVEHRDAVAHRERLVLVVGDEHERDADLALDRLQLDLHLLAELEVESAERLVEQQHRRPVDQRPGERDALALAAGELVRLAARRSRRAAPIASASADAPAALGLATRLHPQAVLDVLLHGHVREQRVVLEHRVDVAVERRRVGDVARRRAAIAPAVGSSKPAIMRSMVVLPEPDGPSSEKNSPAPTSTRPRRPR